MSLGKPSKESRSAENPQPPQAGNSSDSNKVADAVAAREQRSETRRSQRVHIRIPVMIYGHRKENEPFREEALTEVVNAHGGLVRMGTVMSKGQKLILIHLGTQDEQPCSVVHVGRMEKETVETAFEFDQPAARFWRINFPPEDWDPAERKRPRRTRGKTRSNFIAALNRPRLAGREGAC